MRELRRECPCGVPKGLWAVLLAAALFVVALALASWPVFASTLESAAAVERSQAQKREFAKTHPCPSTGKPVPSCPGYVIDHILPLCAGGPDKVANMQWQKLVDSYKKDVRERAYCACMRANRQGCHL